MKLTSTATFLSTVVNGLQAHLLPELTSASAKANGDYLLTILGELLRREQRYADAVPAILDRGQDVASALQAALRPVCGALPEFPARGGDPVSDFNAMSTTIAELAGLAGKYLRDPAARIALLRRAAEWESDSHNMLTTLDVERAPPDSQEPLSRDALQAFVRRRHPDGERAVLAAFDRIMGGFGKQTWAITVNDAAGRSQALIVRKCEKVPVCDHPMFELEREFELLKCVSALDFPAPRPLWMGRDVPGSDGPFYVMERLPGSPPGSYLGGSGTLPEAFVLQWAEVLARLHSISLESLSGFIARYESPTLLDETMAQCYRRALVGWREYAEQVGRFSCSTLTYLFEWLEQNIPDDGSRPSLIHGDFGIHNMLAEDGTVTGLLDWEAATFGSPLIDLSYVRPQVEQHIAWDRFLQHYLACGGPRIDPADIAYYRAYQLASIMVPMNRAVGHVQAHRMQAPRFTMFELGFLPQFMRNALASAQP